MDIGWKYVGKQLLYIIFVVLLSLGFLALGLVIGYGFVGDGKEPLAILSPDKLQNVISKFTSH